MIINDNVQGSIPSSFFDLLPSTIFSPLWIVFSPLFAFLVCALFGRYIGYLGAQIYTTKLMILNIFFSVCIFYNWAVKGSLYELKLCSWIDSGYFIVD